MRPPTDGSTVAEARQWVMAQATVKDMAQCPTCLRKVKSYHRQIHATMARDLAVCYHRHGLDWFNLPDTLGVYGRGTGNFSYLAYWQLAERAEGRRWDGSKNNGWWRVTVTGEWYLHGAVTVPRYARVFLGQFLGLTGDSVGVTDALGKGFDFTELMDS
jgi:hypothetical protein